MSCITRAELDRALPDVLAAPKNGAAISMLCLRPGYGQRRFVGEIHVTPEHGIPGERWANTPWLRTDDGAPHPGIQVSILPKRVLDLVWQDRENVPHPGDTFIADMDMTQENLPTGTILQAGDAQLRVSDVFNDACVKWKVRYGTDAKDWITAPGHPEFRLRGILCSVHQAGTIRNGDALTKLG